MKKNGFFILFAAVVSLTIVGCSPKVMVRATSTPRADDYVIVKAVVDRTVAGKTIWDHAVDCVKDVICKSLFDATVALTTGMDSSSFTTAAAIVVDTHYAGEEGFYTFSLPDGYVYCRSEVNTTTVIPATGDRASFMSATIYPPGKLGVYTWTPVNNSGDKSAIEATFTLIGVRKDIAEYSYANATCSRPCMSKRLEPETPQPRHLFDCRGAKDTNKGLPHCGTFLD